MRYVFGDCTLDTQRYELRRGGERVPLRRKVFQVLVYLLEQRDRVVPRDEILAQVWPDQYVGEESLTSCIKAVRRAVGDSGRAQRVIQTVHGHGLRFVAEVTVAETAPASSPVLASPLPLASPPLQALVGREAELATLHGWYATVQQGRRQVGFITGEAGMGKTALVDAFVAPIAAAGGAWIGHGQCIEPYGMGEAYRPVLEALGRLCRGPQGAHILAWLRQQAPSWLAQMPAVLPVTEREAVLRRAGETTQSRMLRELAEALEILTTERPLLLVLEDLHWSDAATLEWLAYVARRRDPARLLILGTYRPAEARSAAHSVEVLAQDLLVHNQGAELSVGALAEPAVALYVAQRFGEGTLTAQLAPRLYQRTQGHALFLTTTVADLQQRGVVRPGPDGWELAVPLESTTVGVPETLRHLIEQQFARLSPAAQAVLEAASVAGMEFTAAAVAAGVSVLAEEVEMQCATLARQGQFVLAHDTVTCPDGTLTGRYGFGHALYQEVVYERLSVGTRIRMHQQIGSRLEQAYGEQSRTIAAELAEHFVRGRDHPRAVQYGRLAADTALSRHAHREAVTQLSRTLEALAQLPESQERIAQELQVLVTLGRSLMATTGAAAPVVEQTYARAYALCQNQQETNRLLPVLAGLQRFYMVRADYHRARELGMRLLAMAQGLDNQEFVCEGHTILGVVLAKCGQLAAAHTHQEQARAMSPLSPRHRSGLLQDVQVANLVNSTRVLWCLGYPAQALARSQEGLLRARALAEPTSLAFALLQVAHLQFCQRDAVAVKAMAEEVLALTQAQEFIFWEAGGRVLQGWSVVMQHSSAVGIAAMRQGLAALQVTGARIERPISLAMLAEGYGVAADPDAGLVVLAEALAMVEETGERWWEAELYRLRGELLLQVGSLPPPPSQPYPASADIAPQPEACFHRALAIARQQQAKSLELRAAMSLARLRQQQGQREAASALLEPVYSWFTEGFATADLRAARALIEDLA